MRLIYAVGVAELSLTIARGNCSSMNKDIAGNITSLVNGFEEIVAAVAKELNATNTVTLSR
jgi:hypothetical protein